MSAGKSFARVAVRTLLSTAAAVLTIQIAGQPAFADFESGASVECCPYGVDYHPATVTGVVQGGYTVKMTGSGVFKPGEEYIVPKDRIRGITGNAVKTPPYSYGSAVTGLTSTAGNGAGNGGGGNAYAGGGNATTGISASTTTNTGSVKSPYPELQGKGKPPDGKYSCVQWTAGMMVNLGKLDIRGNTYRGFNSSAAFHPFTIDGSGNMVLSGGLSGMPTGFQLRSVKWIGTDHSGRPLIKIAYRGAHANDVIDAILE